MRNEAGTSLRFDLSRPEFVNKSFVSCLELEQKVDEDEKEVGKAEKKADEAHEKARRMIWERYTQILTLLKDCLQSFSTRKVFCPFVIHPQAT